MSTFPLENYPSYQNIRRMKLISRSSLDRGFVASLWEFQRMPEFRGPTPISIFEIPIFGILGGHEDDMSGSECTKSL